MFGAAPTGPSALTRSNSFGGGPSAKKSTPTFSFGSTSTTAAAPSTGFSFGNPPATTNNNNSNSTAGGFSFGNQTQNQQNPSRNTATSGGFSFGNSNPTNTSNPQSTTALFASQPQQPSSGFSFGSNSTTQQPNTNTNTRGGFSFGNSTTNNNQSSGFSFGNNQSTNNNTTNNTASLFGQSQTGNNALGTSGGGLFGQSVGNNQLAMSTNQNSNSPFASYPYHQKERFNDLPEKERKLIEELDNHISSQLKIRDEILSKDFKNEELRKALQMCSDIESSLRNLDASLSSDSKLVQDLSARVESDRNDHVKVYEIANSFRNGNNDGFVYKDFPNQFFSREATEFRERVNRYRATMEQLERTIASTVGGRNQPSPQAIEHAIHAQHQSFMHFASQLANLHSDVESIKKDYRNWYRDQYKSVVDPFVGIESQ